MVYILLRNLLTIIGNIIYVYFNFCYILLIIYNLVILVPFNPLNITLNKRRGKRSSLGHIKYRKPTSSPSFNNFLTKPLY
jgi:hypothetical protein